MGEGDQRALGLSSLLEKMKQMNAKQPLTIE